MLIKCEYCKREFDKKSALKQHKKDAHPAKGVAFYLAEAAKKAAKSEALSPATDEGTSL